jgi:hypothetical protein
VNSLFKRFRPTEGARRLARSVLASLFVAVALLGPGTRPAGAQGTVLPGGTEIYFTPYLWLANVNSTILTPIDRVPQVNSEVGAFQLLGHLSAIPFLGTIEIHDGPLSLYGGAIHLPVGTNITTRNVLFNGGNAGLIVDAGTAVLLYRVFDKPGQFADLGAGFRAWGFSTNVTLNPGILPGQGFNRSAGWVDPLIAGRYHYDFGNGFGLMAYGDVGGFGVGAHSDWQVLGTIDYAPSPWIDLHLGYRSLNFNYTASGGLDLGYNVHMKGPILGATFRF